MSVLSVAAVKRDLRCQKKCPTPLGKEGGEDGCAPLRGSRSTFRTQARRSQVSPVSRVTEVHVSSLSSVERKDSLFWLRRAGWTLLGLSLNRAR